MSVNFYNQMGIMMGVDLHPYWPVGAPKAVNYWPYAVGINFSWFTLVPKKRMHFITMEAEPSFQAGVDFYVVPHIPIPLAPPDGREIGEAALIVFASGSKAWMGVHKVKLTGDKAATCLDVSLGSNQNCCQPIDSIVNLVWNLNSVVTQPTPGDYWGSALGALVDAVLTWAVGNAIDRLGNKYPVQPWAGRFANECIKHLWRRVAEAAEYATPIKTVHDAAKWVAEAPGEIGEALQESVDAELEESGGAR